MSELKRPRPTARPLFWASVWLAVVLVVVKAYYLGVPGRFPPANGGTYLSALAAISYVDVLFAAIVWVLSRAAFALVRGRSLPARAIQATTLSFSAVSLVYAVANVMFFGVFGGFLTYPLLALVGDVRMLSSSVAAYLTPRAIAGLVCLPVVYVALVLATVRFVPPTRGAVWRRQSLGFASVGAWLILGQYAYSTNWTTRQGRGIAENPQWVLISSWWQAVSGDGTVRMDDRFPAEDLSDFAPLGVRPPSPASVLRRISTAARTRGRATTPRSPNVILIVLESVAARWAGLNGGLYDTTPNLVAESTHGIVFDNMYAHIGRSSNSLAAILLSTYPKLDFRDTTEEYPQLGGTSLAAMFRSHGYRTSFITPSNMNWAGWRPFLETHGFDEVRDYHQLPCTDLISSWGVEDRCMVEGMLEFIGQASTRPFFLMGWTTQTHHPYEPTPGVPLLNMKREPVPDQYELGRYLNVIHETDRHLARVFAAVREAGLEQDTIIAVVGDHGQAFGYPHDTYIQGRTVYEEDVHVPLMFWFPRVYRSAARSKTIGGHVDLAPSISELAGIPAAADWQGRSLFDITHPPRAYFYVAEDHFTLGIREGRWKYSFDLREGVDELYDLERDPNEEHDVAESQPELCARLRQRLAAWTEANRRQYGHPAGLSVQPPQALQLR